MELNKELIKRVAEVARIELSEEEVKKFLPQLKEILESFSVIDKADTKGIVESFQPVKLQGVFREDKPGKPLSNKDALKNTEHKKDGYFKGPSAV